MLDVSQPWGVMLHNLSVQTMGDEDRPTHTTCVICGAKLEFRNKSEYDRKRYCSKECSNTAKRLNRARA